MCYFVGYGSRPLDTNWPLPDLAPEHGATVFGIEWAKADGVLIGLFTVGELEEDAVAFVVEPAARLLSLELPVPQDLLPDLPLPDEGMVEVGRRLHPVEDYVGRTLLKIVQDYIDKMKLRLPIRQRRTREKRQKSPEEFVKDIELKAKKRLGQDDFREALLLAFDGRCAISGCSVDAALAAAHILEYSKSECQEKWNGILLRADLHLLFDRHLLRIFPGNPPVVVLDEDIRESEAYKQFHRHPLRLPNPFDERTNQELRGRWEAANQKFRDFPDPPRK